MPSDLKAAFNRTSAVIDFTCSNNGIATSDSGALARLIEAVDQFFVIHEKLGDGPEQNQSFSKDSISQIGKQTISCLDELCEWATRLNLPKEKAILEEITLAIAHWVIKQRGEIRELEFIVNLLAAKANSTSDQSILTSLFHVINDVVEHASPELKSDPDKSNPSRPWRMLNFNCAIVATRSMNPELMRKAFDTLGRNLPEDCPQFFEEGLRQSEKNIYGPEIKTMMAEYLKKWATLH